VAEGISPEFKLQYPPPKKKKKKTREASVLPRFGILEF
jgi:hypothetical protein